MNSERLEQSGASPVQSECQLQPGCPVQLSEPENDEHDQAEPMQLLLDEAQTQP